MSKPCIHCGATKELSDFYAHPGMKDGHLNTCKSCHNAYFAAYKKRIYKDPAALLKYRKYIREYARKRRALGLVKPITKEQHQASKLRLRSNPLKYKASNALSNALRKGKIVRQPCEVCGNPKTHGHHDDYSKPLDIRWLCIAHHHEHHVKQREAALLAQPA